MLRLALVLLLGGCIPQASVRQPELARTDEKSPIKVHFRGVTAKQDTLYVCMFMYDEENLQCVDYVYFQNVLASPPGISL